MNDETTAKSRSSRTTSHEERQQRVRQTTTTDPPPSTMDDNNEGGRRRLGNFFHKHGGSTTTPMDSDEKSRGAVSTMTRLRKTKLLGGGRNKKTDDSATLATAPKEENVLSKLDGFLDKQKMHSNRRQIESDERSRFTSAVGPSTTSKQYRSGAPASLASAPPTTSDTRNKQDTTTSSSRSRVQDKHAMQKSNGADRSRSKTPSRKSHNTTTVRISSKARSASPHVPSRARAKTPNPRDRHRATTPNPRERKPMNMHQSCANLHLKSPTKIRSSNNNSKNSPYSTDSTSKASRSDSSSKASSTFDVPPPVQFSVAAAAAVATDSSTFDVQPPVQFSVAAAAAVATDNSMFDVPPPVQFSVAASAATNSESSSSDALGKSSKTRQISKESKQPHKSSLRHKGESTTDALAQAKTSHRNKEEKDDAKHSARSKDIAEKAKSNHKRKEDSDSVSEKKSSSKDTDMKTKSSARRKEESDDGTRQRSKSSESTNASKSTHRRKDENDDAARHRSTSKESSGSDAPMKSTHRRKKESDNCAAQPASPKDSASNHKSNRKHKSDSDDDSLASDPPLCTEDEDFEEIEAVAEKATGQRSRERNYTKKGLSKPRDRKIASGGRSRHVRSSNSVSDAPKKKGNSSSKDSSSLEKKDEAIHSGNSDNERNSVELQSHEMLKTRHLRRLVHPGAVSRTNSSTSVLSTGVSSIVSSTSVSMDDHSMRSIRGIRRPLRSDSESSWRPPAARRLDSHPDSAFATDARDSAPKFPQRDYSDQREGSGLKKPLRQKSSECIIHHEAHDATDTIEEEQDGVEINEVLPEGEGKFSDSFEGEKIDDVFALYTWSTRQRSPQMIMKERKKIKDSMLNTSFQNALEKSQISEDSSG